ncbi:MAG: ELM1/GtrOC1 family putative glycosyltransferase [Gammaproteobacteria bacterium]|nr:ELM1/GtrOC1 family putative glycosyltransferase [Gammaproteobacteria bacterium]
MPPANVCGTPSPIIVWQFVDGKPGHEKQSTGLLQGLEALHPIEVYDIDVRFKGMLWRQIRRRLGNETPDFASPDLLIGVGHATHLPLLIARRVCGGRSVVLMKPTLPYGLFDLLFVPQHDRVRRRANVVATRGVICPSVAADKEPGSGLMLLGGTSAHFEWSNPDIGKHIEAIVRASPDVRWQVCDSRRTPDGIRGCIRSAPNLTFRHWQTAPADFLEKTLPRTEYVWVSADSASMLYESLAAQARVGIIALRPKRRRGNKHAVSLEALIADGYVVSSNDGYRLTATAARPRFPPENHRCAKIMLDRLVGRED